MENIIITRHQPLVDWLALRGITGAVIAQATADDVRGKHVYGVLPMWPYANWLAGIVHVTSLSADVTGLAHWLVSLRPILLSGVLPSLVIYLSEIVSSNYQNELSEAQKQAKKGSREPLPMVSNSQVIPQNDTLSIARDTKKVQTDERRERVLSLLNSGKSQAVIADELQVSLATVKRDTRALNGKVTL